MFSLQGGGEESWAFMKRQVIASGIIFGLLGFRRWSGAIKDCNDDDEGYCVGKGKLSVLGAFGDLSKSVGSCNGNGGSSRLLRLQFELDFHFPASKNVGNRQ
jgi:hypothetical protein